MKIKTLVYCQEKIDGQIVVLDVGKIIDVQDEDAMRLISKNKAEEVIFENKMIDIVYKKKRGRPPKENNI